MDFLFILRPNAPASLDQILIVEIKRGYMPDGKSRRVSADEVDKFHRYALSVRRSYATNSMPPSINGLMIANAYTEEADMVRKSLQSVSEVKLEFQTWETVIENTKRLHTGWLEVTRRSVHIGQTY